MSEKRKVFVSYSRADKDKVLHLVKNLEKTVGTKFWIDESGIESTAQFLNVIRQAIKDCQIVLFMLSDNSINGEWTQREIMFAKECGKRVVPVILDGRGLRDWAELYFVNVNYVDATSKSQLEKLSNEIVDWLGHESVVESSGPKQNPPLKPRTIAVKQIMSRLAAPLKNILSIIAVLLIILFVVGIYLGDDEEEVDEKEPQETEMEQRNDTIDSSSVNIAVEPVVETVPTTKPTTTETSSQKVSTLKAPITETPTENKLNISKDETTTTSPTTTSTTSSTTSQLATLSPASIEEIQEMEANSGQCEEFLEKDTLTSKVEPETNLGTEKKVKSEAETKPNFFRNWLAHSGIKYNNKEFVDLGLSVKWATCNIGALYVKDDGDEYAWGETATKKKFTKKNSSTYGKSMGDIGGNPSYDAARANWGGEWQMPTDVEYQELLDNCAFTWTTYEGIKGYMVTSKKNGASIFFPVSSMNGDWGGYWLSVPCSDDNEKAKCFGIDANGHGFGICSRYVGLLIRPVFNLKL